MLPATPIVTSDFCKNFPILSDRLIERDNYIATVEETLRGDTHVVFLEGTEQIGKTTLLAQLAKKFPHRSLSMFIDANVRLSYSIDGLKQSLGEQAHWIVQQSVPSANSTIDQAKLNRLLSKLQSHKQRISQPILFLIDGLEELSRIEERVVEEVLRGVLQIGLSEFRYVIAGESSVLSKFLPGKVRHKTYPLAKFSLSEARQYLDSLGFSDGEISDIYQVCEGRPGYLASVVRMREQGLDVLEILANNDGPVPDFIAMEWDNAKIVTDDERRVFSTIVESHHPLPPSDVARVTGVSVALVEQLINRQNFVKLTTDGEIRWQSDAHRRHVLSQLKSMRETTLDAITRDILEHQSEAGTLLLPNYYRSMNRPEKVLETLSPEFFGRALSQELSLSPAIGRASTGLEVALQANRASEVLRFSLHASSLASMLESTSMRSAIEARMSLGQQEVALSIAQSAVLAEHKLYLLSVIARIMREKREAVPSELLQQIRHLVNLTEVWKLGSLALEVASELVCIDAQLAISIIDQVPTTMVRKVLTKYDSDVNSVFSRLPYFCASRCLG